MKTDRLARFRSVRPLALIAVVALPACGPPPDALVSRCTTPALSLVTTCQLTAQVLRQERSAFVDGGTGHERLHLKARFAVGSGQVSVALPCTNGRLSVSSAEPASIECDATVDRGSRTIRIDVTPATPGPQGFSGTLEFRPL